MALLNVFTYPDPRLKLAAKPATAFDDALTTLHANLLETMYKNDGVDLAATQVNVQQRIFVLDISIHQSQKHCCINPVITQKSGDMINEEGCLSFPNIYAKVKRHAEITVEFFDLQGQQQILHGYGLLAVCIQHEIDHLDGITFFDHLSPVKKKLIRKKLDKQRDKIS